MYRCAEWPGEPADYIRKLPPHLAAQCVDAGQDKHFEGRDAMESKALVHANGTAVLLSPTSNQYARFWNQEVFDRCFAERQGYPYRGRRAA